MRLRRVVLTAFFSGGLQSRLRPIRGEKLNTISRQRATSRSIRCGRNSATVDQSQAPASRN